MLLCNTIFNFNLFAAVAGSSPVLSLLSNHLKDNWFLGALIAGIISMAISVIIPLLFVKGLVLMSIITISLSLAACGRVGVTG
jgi:hypothetical protein